MKPFNLVIFLAVLLLSGCATTTVTTPEDVSALQSSPYTAPQLADQSQYPPYVTLTKLSDVHSNTKSLDLRPTQTGN